MASSKRDYGLYNKTAEVYDSERFSGRAGTWGHDRQLDILKRVTGDLKNKKVLEIGCGTGRITAALVRWGASVTAADISSEMIEVARARFNSGEYLSMPEFRVMSVSDIDMDLKKYDLVIMVNVLGRLSAPREAIQKISSRISPECRFIFNFPCVTSILALFGLIVNFRGKSILRDVTSYWYMPGTIEKYCRDAGLDIVSWYGNHYVPLPRFLFPLFPLFWISEMFLAKSFPKRCPSVLAECKRGS